MEINREFYDGNATTVTDGAATPHLLYQYLNDTMYAKINANAEKYLGEWDKSICPWKINAAADFINPDYILAWNDGTSWFVDKSPLYEERRKGYTFYLSVNGSNFHDRYDNDTYGANFCAAWLGTLTASSFDIQDTVCNAWVESKYDRINPIIDFDYSKIFVVPTVNGNPLNPNLETNFDPTTISSLGFAFYCKDMYDFGQQHAIGIVSLNNKMALPEWSEYCTDSFDEENMIDNGFFITPYWIEHTNLHPLPSLGTRPTWVAMPWRTRSEMLIPGATGTGFTTQSQTAQSAAATVNYFPNKAIYISAGNDDIYGDYSAYYAGGTTGYFQESVIRYLKSTVTYADLVDYLALQCAYLGFRFCLDVTKINEASTSQYFYIPEIDSKGVTTGNYAAVNSAEAQNYINYTWESGVFDITPYDGTDDDEGGDPNEYDEDNQTVLNSEAYKAKNYFFNVYAVNTIQLKQLSEYMYSEMPTNANQDNFLTNNAIDVIVSLMMFPIDFAAISTVDYLTLGKLQPTYYDEEAQEDKRIFGWIPDRNIVVYPCGSCTYYPVYGVDDFRNYEPYCTAELELPYCGNIKLPTSVYLNHTIRVTYLIDLITGSCMALVFRDDLVYTTAQGQMGVQFPLSGIQSQDLQASIMRKQTQYGESLINVARSVIGGGISIAGATQAASTTGGLTGTLGAVTGVASAFNQLEQAEYNIEHIQVPFTMHGASSPLTSFANEQYPRLIVKRPRMLPEYDPVAYGHIAGFACNITAALSEFSGLTVCATANLDGIAATEAEKQLIRRALLEGVIL